MKQRRTKLAIQIEKQSIIDLLRTGYSDAQVKQQLNLSDRVYGRRIKEMREESLKEVLNRESTEAKTLLLYESIAKIKALERRANLIIEEASDDTVRMAAMDRARTYAIDIAKLLTEGPFMFNLIQRDGLHIGDKRTAAELATEDPNRVA